MLATVLAVRRQPARLRTGPNLFEELTLAHAEGSYTRFLARMDVLVLDDRGLAPLRDQDRRDLLERTG